MDGYNFFVYFFESQFKLSVLTNKAIKMWFKTLKSNSWTKVKYWCVLMCVCEFFSYVASQVTIYHSTLSKRFINLNFKDNFWYFDTNTTTRFRIKSAALVWSRITNKLQLPWLPWHGHVWFQPETFLNIYVYLDKTWTCKTCVFLFMKVCLGWKTTFC